jgi:class 3 adenylate cyclase/tetratricopeptide (TPR) repeat protein
VAEERKVVTVLFADLVGFTTRAEQVDIEDVQAFLAPYHAALRREVERTGGVVAKFIGDGMMAVFGAPVAHEDDPERAVRCALAIRDAMADAGSLQVRVGVTTGEALVSSSGGGQVDAVGDVVNTAARLESAAPVDSILVGETTYHATDRAIVYRPAEPVTAKGKAEPVPVWEAIEARARLGVDVVQRPTTPLVGRGEEVDLLQDALRRCRAERTAQLITLVGVPGIGKSRLVWELMQAVEGEPDYITWRQGRSLPYGDGVTFWALGEMVKAQAGILDSDAAHEAEAKLQATVADLIDDPGEAAWVAEHVRVLAGLEPQSGLVGDRHSEAVAAWRRFLEALADRDPLVLVFEDLHWADDALLDFIDNLAGWVVDVPMLVVCTARPELLDRRAGWGGGKRNAITVALSPLADADIARLIGSLLEQALLPAETQATLLTTAAGNPLYAEEYVRMLIDRGHLHHGDGRWRLTAGAQLPVPESVQGLIAARVDDLPAEQKALLQDAAVLGKVVWLGALASMGDVGRGVAAERLHALERREMLRRERRSTVAGDTEYAFRHVLMRDVAYGQIPRIQRADKHQRAAEWIESLTADRGDAPDMLAHHYSLALQYSHDAGRPIAGLELRTRLALRDAGDRARALGSLTAAQQHYHAALALWPKDDPFWPELVIATADAGLSAPGDDFIMVLLEARDRLVARGDLGDAAMVEMLNGFRFWNEARSDEAMAAFARAADLLERAEPSPVAARVASRIAIMAMLRGQFEETIAMCDRALAIADQFDLEDIRGHVLNTRGVALVSHRGDLRGLDDLEASIAIVERINDVEGMIRSYKNLGSTLQNIGELPRATELEHRGIEVARRYGVEYQVTWFDTELALISYWAGNWDAAVEAFARLDRRVSEIGPHYMQQPAHGTRASIHAARGESAGAAEDMLSALEFGRRSAEPQVLLPALAEAALVEAVQAGAEAPRRVADLCDELAAIPAPLEAGYWSPLAALATALTGAPQRFAALDVQGPSRWHSAAVMIADARYLEAADELADIGGRPQEAMARLLAARALISEGNRPDGEAELRRAVAFWAGVRAVRLLALAEDLMARTA